MRLITKITFILTIILALSLIIMLGCNQGTNMFAGGSSSILPQFIDINCWEITAFAFWGSVIGGPILIAIWLFIVIKYFSDKNKEVKGGKNGK